MISTDAKTSELNVASAAGPTVTHKVTKPNARPKVVFSDAPPIEGEPQPAPTPSPAQAAPSPAQAAPSPAQAAPSLSAATLAEQAAGRKSIAR